MLRDEFTLSFEFFPPKTTTGEEKLMRVAQELQALKPEFYSVTFGARGSIREKTPATVINVKNTTGVNVAPHLTTIGSSKDQIKSLLNHYQDADVNRLVVLRGDYASGMNGVSGELHYASQLVEYIRQKTQDHFIIEVAAYPEFHPEANSAIEDFNHFKQKVAAGANSAITQYFYNPDAYYYFLDLCAKNNITIPIVPGIMPIMNLTNLQRFSKICGAQIPCWLLKRLESFTDDESLQEFGIEVVSRLCEKLIEYGAPGLHFYTLNKSEPTTKICCNLKI